LVPGRQDEDRCRDDGDWREEGVGGRADARDCSRLRGGARLDPTFGVIRPKREPRPGAELARVAGARPRRFMRTPTLTKDQKIRPLNIKMVYSRATLAPGGSYPSLRTAENPPARRAGSLGIFREGL
jgi:hypothetical protein